MEAKRLEGAVYRSGEEVFRQLFRQYGPTVYYHLLDRCGNPQVARSLLKDIFAEVYRDITEASTVDVTAIWLKSLANERLARLRAGGDVVKLAAARVMQQQPPEIHRQQPAAPAQTAHSAYGAQTMPNAQSAYRPAEVVAFPPAQYQQAQYQQAQPAQRPAEVVAFPPVQQYGPAQAAGAQYAYQPQAAAQAPAQPVQQAQPVHPQAAAQPAVQPVQPQAAAQAQQAQQAQHAQQAQRAQQYAVPATQAAGPGQPIPGLIRPAGETFVPYIPTGKQEKEKKRNRGRIALIVVLSVMIVFTMWMLAGLLMEVQVLPKMDWGYTWFNTHIFQLF